MKKLLFLFIVFFSNVAMSDIRTEKMKIEFVDCENRICAKLTFKNKTKKPICLKTDDINNTDFNTGAGSFQIIDMSTNQALPYAGYEIFVTHNDSAPTSVWWIPPKKAINSTHDFAKFYNLQKGKKYKLTYQTIAYFCKDYENRNPDKRIKIKGKKKFTYP